jgi:hypothetical protein
LNKARHNREQLAAIDLGRFISEAQHLVWAPDETRRRIEASAVKLAPANFYSSIPSLAELDAAFDAPAGVSQAFYSEVFDQDRCAAMLARLTPFGQEFSAPDIGSEARPEQGFFWENSQFSGSDALAYYAMLRLLKPRTVVEIGSGFSTLVADAALRANGSGEVVAIEPFPRPFLRTIPSVRTVIEKPVQTLDRDELAATLGDGDVLFIDSTHTVKAGSDCLWIYLHLLPALRNRIMVHSHDIFLPFPMPVAWARDHHIYWTEQYLLYAYLLHNPTGAVVYGSTYAEHFLAVAAREFLPKPRPLGGGSVWYGLNGAADVAYG